MHYVKSRNLPLISQLRANCLKIKPCFLYLFHFYNQNMTTKSNSKRKLSAYYLCYNKKLFRFGFFLFGFHNSQIQTVFLHKHIPFHTPHTHTHTYIQNRLTHCNTEQMTLIGECGVIDSFERMLWKHNDLVTANRILWGLRQICVKSFEYKNIIASKTNLIGRLMFLFPQTSGVLNKSNASQLYFLFFCFL